MGNRRRHRRVPFASSVALRFRDSEEGEPIEALTTDISMSGIGLYVNGPIEIDRDVSIEITFIGTERLIKTDYVEGHIVYMNKIEKINFIGIEFDKELNPNSQPFLFECLQRVLQWE